jgi:hypothetical protein
MPDKARFIDVGALMPQISVEQVADFYGVALPEIQRRGDEIRAKCFLNCGFGEATGPRALAINVDDPAKKWKCHQYGCGKGGNLVSLCDLLKPGASCDGRPRGERFKEIARDLLAMSGQAAPERDDRAAVRATEQEATKGKREEAATARNVPLARSENERARGLVNLDEKFVRDMAAMTPAAAKYLRRRTFLTAEIQAKWRMGYLPRGGPSSDQSGGTMRGRIVYPVLSELGEVLTWFGRDPEFEGKHEAWTAGGKREREPEKFHFVKGFHRGQELFGQHASRLKEPGFRDALQEFGLIVVEGPNDVIRLDTLGIPAVGLCSSSATAEQIAKIARFARTVAGNRATLMLDLDAAGDVGTEQTLFQLAKLGVNVRLGWSAEAIGQDVAARQPEELTSDEWRMLQRELSCKI